MSAPLMPPCSPASNLIPLHTSSLRLCGDERRVILLPFVHGYRLQVRAVLDLINRMSDNEAAEQLRGVCEKFGGDHDDLTRHFLAHYETARKIAACEAVGETRCLLAGAYFTMEYAIEAAALFNPSAAPHPDQTGLADGELRFIMSLRAVGEGHVSSVVFRVGTLRKNGVAEFMPLPQFSAPKRISPDHRYNKPLFRKKLTEIGVNPLTADMVLNRLPDSFALTQLEEEIAKFRKSGGTDRLLHGVWETMLWLARSNYRLVLPEEADLTEHILYPNSDDESRGIEDMRLVRFMDDDGETTYFGTYTAYNGVRVLPMLMETKDFRTMSMHSLNGACAQNKGFALFPRRIDGHYAMCSRIDGRNLFLMFSDYVHFWESARLLAEPKYPWEYRLIGNCGSPLETPEGWLLLTHGVGSMRQYSIGAMLLDAKDPFRIRGRLRTPLLTPPADERAGYVPNVVYSCGALLHKDRVFLPYAIADQTTAADSVELHPLLDRLLADGP